MSSFIIFDILLFHLLPAACSMVITKILYLGGLQIGPELALALFPGSESSDPHKLIPSIKYLDIFELPNEVQFEYFI